MKGSSLMMDGATDGINPLDIRNDPKGAGAALLRQGNFGEAAAVLKEAAAMTPDDEETFSLLGAALASKGDAIPAIDAFKRAAELGPTNPRSHFNLGLAYQAANRLSEARSALERAVNLNPGYDAARAKLSEVAQRMGGASAAPSMTPTVGSGAAPAAQTTNIVGGGDSSMLLSVGSRYTPPGSASEGTSNIQAGGDASSLASIGQQATATAAQNASQAAEQEGHTNISGGSGAGFSLSDVGTGRAPVRDTGTTNIGGGATAAMTPSASPVLRAAPPVSVGPSSTPPSAAPSSYAPPAPYPSQSAPGTYAPPAPVLGMNYGSENNSGMKGEAPQEVAGWSWAGFGMSFMDIGWIWAANMRLTVFAVLLFLAFAVPIGIAVAVMSNGPSSSSATSASITGVFSLLFGLGRIGLAIYLGINGNKLAWQNRRFESVEDFRACQRVWGWWTLGVFIASILFWVFIFLVFGMIAMAALSGAAGGAGRRF